MVSISISAENFIPDKVFVLGRGDIYNFIHYDCFLIDTCRPAIYVTTNLYKRGHLLAETGYG